MRGQSFYDWCIENNRENLLSEWEYNKNYPLTPLIVLEERVKRYGGNAKKDMSGKQV